MPDEIQNTGDGQEKPSGPAENNIPCPGCGPHSEGDVTTVVAEEPSTDPKKFAIGVVTGIGGRAEDFFWNLLDLRVGDQCVVDGDGILSIGTVAITKKVAGLCPKRGRPHGKVVRKATDDDVSRAASLAVKEKDAMRYCRGRILEHDLAMNLSKVVYNFDGSKAVFYFTAENRVDFRDLVRDISSFTRVKVEMRQIGVRDETRMLGGCGPCGVELCCARYLSDFAPVSIRMAKDQNLSLNPAKISGVCGRLMCCLGYEHEHYRAIMERMPRMNKSVITMDGRTGKVYNINALAERVGVVFEDGSRMEFAASDVSPAHKGPPQKKKEDETAQAAPPPQQQVQPAPARERLPETPAHEDRRPEGVSPGAQPGRKRPRRKKKKSFQREGGAPQQDNRQQPPQGQDRQQSQDRPPRPERPQQAPGQQPGGGASGGGGGGGGDRPEGGRFRGRRRGMMRRRGEEG
ncbi:MAG: hypothetical protein HZB29_06280 [Nitrospinae bacterium]|nr:hypothetical protein [Nitrospinota bacterium]